MTSFYFYDLETSGFRTGDDRIMQFGGQRTDMDLKPIGEPHNFLIKMTEEILPQPDAILLTGITPQKTIAEGITEAEFLKIFYREIALKDTIFIGFNNVRFDDEFIRYLNYRNFYDAYEWHWADGRSRWDLLDVIRMTRALRPEGIKWPFDSSGAASNRLELLSSINGLDHANAHDALSDVQASIAVAKLIQQKQPKLFAYLLKYRDKKMLEELVNQGEPFVYTSGKYPSQFEKTTVVMNLGKHPKKNGVFVYDLRHDPDELKGLSVNELANRWQHRCDEYPCPHPILPVKVLQFNRCPAVAPLGVLDKPSQKRLKLDMNQVAKNQQKLAEIRDELLDKLKEVTKILDKAQQARLINDEATVDNQLYDGFISDEDKKVMARVVADANNLSSDEFKFKDDRLSALLLLYRARNFPKTLSDEERHKWEQFRRRRLLGGKNDSRAAKYFRRLAELAENPNLSDEKKYLLQELQLYGQGVLPTEAL